MTSKEAIEKAWELVNSKHLETNEEIQLVRYAVRTARELEERDIPMKPLMSTHGYTVCPKCKRVVHNGYKGCPYCLQRLEWRDRK